MAMANSLTEMKGKKINHPNLHLVSNASLNQNRGIAEG
jgi:hypothetical protein